MGMEVENTLAYYNAAIITAVIFYSLDPYYQLFLLLCVTEDQGDQKIRKKLPNFSKSSQNIYIKLLNP